MIVTCHRSHFEERCFHRGYSLARAYGCVVSAVGDILAVDTDHVDYPAERVGALGFKCVPDCTSPEFACGSGECCVENGDGSNSCQNCGYCNFKWASTYSCSTLEWSQPVSSVVFSQTKAVESTAWDVSGTTATWNNEGVSGSSQGYCDGVLPPSPPERLTVYPAELDGVTASSSSRMCQAWARTQFRIGSAADAVEQVWLVPGGAQVSNTQRNADWEPTAVNEGDPPQAIIYPPTTSTQSFYITYDPASRRLVYKLQNATMSTNQTSAESRIEVPANKLTSQTLNYPINIFLGASGVALTTQSRLRLHDCTLSVTGEPAVQIPDLEAVWPGPTASQNRYLKGRLGKGFTISGYVTMGWTGQRPTGSNLQGWFGFVDTTVTPTPVGIL